MVIFEDLHEEVVLRIYQKRSRTPAPQRLILTSSDRVEAAQIAAARRVRKEMSEAHDNRTSPGPG